LEIGEEKYYAVKIISEDELRLTSENVTLQLENSEYKGDMVVYFNRVTSNADGQAEINSESFYLC